MNHYCDVWFWRASDQAEVARHLAVRTRTTRESGKPRRASLSRLVVLPLLRVVGPAEKPVDARPVEREEAAMRKSCGCGRDDEFEYREPMLDDDGEWVLRCPECGHLDHLRWLSDEARPLVLGLARRRGRLRLRRTAQP